MTDFTDFASTKLAPILDQSGKVIYSAEATLQPGSIYFMGENPGGIPGAVGTTTIATNLASFPGKTTNDYLDEQWNTQVIQDRVIALFGGLDINLRQICASNGVFVRTPRGMSRKDYNSLADICWPVHQYALNIVQPRLILIFGKLPYEFIWAKVGNPERVTFDGGHKTQYEEFVWGNRTVMYLPHLRYYPVKPVTLTRIKHLLMN